MPGMLRFYCDSIVEGEMPLDSVEAHHLIHVMRVGRGQCVELFDGNGTVAEATVVSLKRKDVTVSVEHIETVTPRETGRVIIATSTAKGQRFDWLISKCTELGVDAIHPILYERTVKLARGKNTQQRYTKLMIAAAKQCGLNFLPVVSEPAPLTEALETLQKDYPKATMVFGSLNDDVKPLAAVMEKDKDVIAFVGPEGGMTQEEETLLKDAGAIEVTLTKTVLRVETAAAAFATILCVGRD